MQEKALRSRFVVEIALCDQELTGWIAGDGDGERCVTINAVVFSAAQTRCCHSRSLSLLWRMIDWQRPLRCGRGARFARFATETSFYVRGSERAEKTQAIGQTCRRSWRYEAACQRGLKRSALQGSARGDRGVKTV